MKELSAIDASNFSFDIHKNFKITAREKIPGLPKRTDAMTVGIITMEQSAPHGGEIHPDGDEVLYVMYGRLRITREAAPNEELFLGPGQACIVPAGQWHKVDVLEKTQLVHMTPGPNGDHRPLKKAET